MGSTIEENVCRLCTNRGYNYHFIFGTNTDLIAYKIHTCLPININPNDKLPAHVCNACLEALDITNKLITQCLWADATLRTQLRLSLIKDTEKIKQEKNFSPIKTETKAVHTEFNTYEEINICQESTNAAQFEDSIDIKEESLPQPEEISIPTKTKEKEKVKDVETKIVPTNSGNLIVGNVFEDSIDIKEENIIQTENIPIVFKDKEEKNVKDIEVNVSSTNAGNLILDNVFEDSIDIKEENLPQTENVSSVLENKENSTVENVEDNGNDSENPDNLILDTLFEGPIGLNEEDILDTEDLSIITEDGENICSEDVDMIIDMVFEDSIDIKDENLPQVENMPSTAKDKEKVSVEDAVTKVNPKTRDESMVDNVFTCSIDIKRENRFELKNISNIAANKENICVENIEMNVDPEDSDSVTNYNAGEDAIDIKEEGLPPPIDNNILEDSIEIKDENLNDPEMDDDTDTEDEGNTHCDICNVIIINKMLMAHHAKFHQLRSVFCNTCRKTFPSPYDLYVHKKAAHKMLCSKFPMKWFCETCELITNSPIRAIKHIRECKKPKHQCKACKEEFVHKQELSLHMKMNHKANPDEISDGLRCKICKKNYVNKDAFLNHLPMHQKVKMYPCADCDKTFRRTNDLKHHIERFHDEPKIYECSICSKTFGTNRSMKKHKSYHSKCVCKQCGQQCNDLVTLNQHLLKEHNMQPFNLNKHSCKQCDKSFKHRRTLVEHEYIHTGERPYTCKLCDKSFRTHCAFWKHEKMLHGKSDFSCDYCKRKFNNKINLAKHIPTHQRPEDWLYSCEICNIKFPNDLRLHYHLEKAKDTHLLKCDVCDMKLLGMHRLKRHKRRKHFI